MKKPYQYIQTIDMYFQHKMQLFTKNWDTEKVSQ